jgi:recombination DNA repair RAD52 pathway protein
MNFDSIIQGLFTALITGFGAGIGNYLSQKQFITKLEKLNKKIKRRVNGINMRTNEKE